MNDKGKVAMVYGNEVPYESPLVQEILRVIRRKVELVENQRQTKAVVAILASAIQAANFLGKLDSYTLKDGYSFMRDKWPGNTAKAIKEQLAILGVDQDVLSANEKDGE